MFDATFETGDFVTTLSVATHCCSHEIRHTSFWSHQCKQDAEAILRPLGRDRSIESQLGRNRRLDETSERAG